MDDRDLGSLGLGSWNSGLGVSLFQLFLCAPLCLSLSVNLR